MLPSRARSYSYDHARTRVRRSQSPLSRSLAFPTLIPAPGVRDPYMGRESSQRCRIPMQRGSASIMVYPGNWNQGRKCARQRQGESNRQMWLDPANQIDIFGRQRLRAGIEPRNAREERASHLGVCRAWPGPLCGSCWSASCACGYVFDAVADAHARWPNTAACAATPALSE